MLSARNSVTSTRRQILITTGLMLIAVALACIQRVESKFDCNKNALADAAAQWMVTKSAQPGLDKSLLVIQEKLSQFKQADKLENMSSEQEEVLRYNLAIDELSELKRWLDGDDLTDKVSTFLDNDYIRVCTQTARGSSGNKSVDQLRKVLEITRWDLWALERQRQHLAWKLGRRSRTSGSKWSWLSGDKGQPQKTAKKLLNVLVRQIAAIILNMYLDDYESTAEALQQTDPAYAKSRLIEKLEHKAELLLGNGVFV